MRFAIQLSKYLARTFPDSRVKSSLRNLFFRYIAPRILVRHPNLELAPGITASVTAPRFAAGSTSTIELEGYLKHHPLQRGEVILDIGAYIGLFTILASRQVGDEGLVIAIEADPANFDLLQKNIRENGLTNVRALCVGVGETPGTLYLHSRGNCSELSTEREMRRGNSTMVGTPIPVTTIDTICHQHDLRRVSFIKMDIEGAELTVLNGARKLIERDRPSFAVASYHVIDGQQTCVSMEQQFREFGYETSTGFRQHLTTWANA